MYLDHNVLIAYNTDNEKFRREDMQNQTRNVEFLSPVWSRYNSIIAVRGEGSYIYDQNGDRYLDFTSGIGVTNTGHCHPRVVEAVKRQSEKLLHGQVNIILHEPILALIGELRGILNPKFDRFFFSNSGAEAVEGAFKLARHATRKTNIIVFQGSFHGRTVGTMSLTTSKTIYRAGYQPLMPGVFVAPYPYSFRYGWEDDYTTNWCLNELEFLLKTQTSPEETAAIIVEPVLGEGGYVVPPKNFLTGVREICDEYQILLVIDEIQSGFGRTGRWFAYEHFNVDPDIIIIAKGLASGLPISGVISTKELMDKWIVGSHGGTYGGNALASAAAIATIQTIRDEGLLKNSIERGMQLISGLSDLQKSYKQIADIRGLGLMVGCEFRDGENNPDKAFAKRVLNECLKRRLLVLTCGPWDNTIRFIPPLIVTEQQIADSLQIFRASLSDIEQ
jgi:4-aminobutyrate aminotransferase